MMTGINISDGNDEYENDEYGNANDEYANDEYANDGPTLEMPPSRVTRHVSRPVTPVTLESEQGIVMSDE